MPRFEHDDLHEECGVFGAFGYPESVNDDSGELWLMYNQLGLYFELSHPGAVLNGNSVTVPDGGSNAAPGGLY